MDMLHNAVRNRKVCGPFAFLVFHDFIFSFQDSCSYMALLMQWNSPGTRFHETWSFIPKQRIVGSYDTSISDCIILIMPE